MVEVGLGWREIEKTGGGERLALPLGSHSVVSRFHAARINTHTVEAVVRTTRDVSLELPLLLPETETDIAVFPILADVVEVKTGSWSTAHWSNDFIRLNGWLRNCFAQLIIPFDIDGIGQNWEDSNTEIDPAQALFQHESCVPATDLFTSATVAFHHRLLRAPRAPRRPGRSPPPASLTTRPRHFPPDAGAAAFVAILPAPPRPQ